jgi:hypothetical protein
MKLGRIIAVIALIVLIAGCSGYKSQKKAQSVFESPIAVETQVAEGIDFNKYGTWTWLPGVSGLTGRERLDDPRFESFVKSTISNRLFERGYVQDNTKPNLLISYYASVEDINEDVIEDKYDGIYSPDYQMELPESEKKKKREWEEGSLFIFVFDVETQQIVWYSSAQAEVYGNMTDEMRAERIKKAVAMMMEEFPRKIR